MKLLKRVFQGMINLRKRTLILSALFLLVLTLLISGSAVQGALSQILEKNKSNVNSIVNIEIDLDKMMQSMMGGSGNDGGGATINDELVNKVKKSQYIKDYSVSAEVPIFTQYDGTTTEKNKAAQNTYSMPDGKLGILDSTNEKIAAANINLVEGKYPSESKDKNPVLISKAFAERHHVKVGDAIKMNIATFDEGEPKRTTTKVSGIFSYTNNNDAILKDDEVNRFYANRDLVKDFNAQQFGGDMSTPLANYKKIKVELKNPMDAEKFINEIQADGKDYSALKFTSSLKEYKAISKMIDSISTIFSVVKIIIFVVAGIITALIMLLSLRERKYEIGLLLSLGETKLRIIGQIFLEVAIILVLAFGISYGVSSLVTTPYATGLVNTELETKVASNAEAESAVPKGPNYIEDNSTKLNADTAITKADVVQGDEAWFVFLIILAITALATALPTMRMVRKSPKTILTDTE